MRLPSLALGIAIAVALAGVGSADVSPRRGIEHDWKDVEGRVIKRLDRSGRLFLYTWDMEGRIARIDAIPGPVTDRAAEGAIDMRDACTHTFLWDGEGWLAAEIDGLGVEHRFTFRNTASVDFRRGTALPGHRHGAEARRVRFVYAPDGALIGSEGQR